MKTLIIGLDLSLESTGICSILFEDLKPLKIKFNRVVYDNSKTGKHRIPIFNSTINNTVYRMPTNISIDDILFSHKDKNNLIQLDATLRAMICSKKINTICLNTIEKYQPDKLYVSIENYIMPRFATLGTVSKLILLQGFVREFLIRYKLKTDISLKIFTETPRTLKKFFAADGKADKIDMFNSFIENFNGSKLMPYITANDLKEVNDVVDAFALAVNCYGKIISKNNIKK